MGGRAVALVVVGHGSAFSRLQRQARLGSVERLDLALSSMETMTARGGRVHVEPDDILDLFGEVRVGRPLEVRKRCGWRRCFSHSRCTARSEMPAAFAMVRPVQWVAAPGGCEQVISEPARVDLLRERRSAGLAGLVAQQGVDDFFGVALLPAPHGRPADAGAPGDFQHGSRSAECSTMLAR